MAQEYYPFDSGPGESITETQWRRMARLWVQSGVEEGLVVTAGSGSTVNLSAGSAWVDGHYYRTDAAVAVSFTPNTLATPQTVRVVLRLNPTANTITPMCITTAPSSSPTGNWDLLLYEFTLPPSGTAQTPTGITDRRSWTGASPWTSAGLTIPSDITQTTPLLWRVAGNYLELRGRGTKSSLAANSLLLTLPVSPAVETNQYVSFPVWDNSSVPRAALLTTNGLEVRVFAGATLTPAYFSVDGVQLRLS